MKKKTQRIVVVVLALALLVTVLVPALSILTSATVTQDDIDELESQLDDITQQKEQVHEHEAERMV